MPELIKTKVIPSQTVTFEKTEENIIKHVAEPYTSRELHAGDKIVLDFGDHYVGFLGLALNYKGSHPDAPVLLRIHFAEQPVELFEDCEKYHGWISSSWIEEERIHLDQIPCSLQLERRYAFRYVLLEVLAISSKYSLVVESAQVTAVSSADDSKLLPFATKDKQLSDIYRISCRTLHECMQMVFEDGPKRDRRLWMGDLRIQAKVNYVTYQNNELVKKCLYLFAGLPMENGQIGACLFLEPKPEVDDTVMFDYSLFFINTLYDYYENTKDVNTLRELWPVAKKQIAIAKEKLGQDMIVKDSDVLGWCFVDWNLELNKQASAQGIFLYALNDAVKIAQILEDVSAEESFSELYCDMKKAAMYELFDFEKGYFLSGANRQLSVASQVWMILGGVLEGDQAKKALERAMKSDTAVKMVTPYMYHHYIEALLYLGKKDMALDEIRTYWGGMVDLGADTFWELYNPMNPNESPYGGTIVNSYCHAWSCGPAYFLQKYFEE